MLIRQHFAMERKQSASEALDLSQLAFYWYILLPDMALTCVCQFMFSRVSIPFRHRAEIMCFDTTEPIFLKCLIGTKYYWIPLLMNSFFVLSIRRIKLIRTFPSELKGLCTRPSGHSYTIFLWDLREGCETRFMNQAVGLLQNVETVFMVTRVVFYR